MAHESEPGKWALAYARLGWRVLPIVPVRAGACGCGQQCASPGKHPLYHRDDLAHGVHSATDDPERISAWWRRWPDANIAVATGVMSGIVVLDVDERSGGRESLGAIRARFGGIPATVTSLTGGGGEHHVFRHPGGTVRNRTGADAPYPGVEIKGDGGYIVVPPSLHLSGRRYTWESGYEPGRHEIADAPGWLRDLVAESKSAVSAPRDDAIPEGSRNVTLTRLAGSMRRHGMTYEEIRIALLAVNERRCRPELPQAAVESIARSISRYEPTDAPWQAGKPSDVDPEPFSTIQPLIRIATDPPRYIATVHGRQMELSLDELANFNCFKRACIARRSWVPVLRRGVDAAGQRLTQQATWERDYVTPALESLEDHVTAPEDAGESGALWHAIQEYFRTQRHYEEREKLVQGGIWDAGDHLVFRGHTLRAWLRQNHIETRSPAETYAIVRSHGGSEYQIKIAGSNLSAWRIPKSACPFITPAPISIEPSDYQTSLDWTDR